MEYEYNSIFVESNETVGILYKSYKPVMKSLDDFIFKMESLIRKFNKNPEETDVDLSSDITKFRNEISITPKPAPIEIGKIKALKSQVKNARLDLDINLKRFAKLKNELSYGGSFFDSIIRRPKVYTKDINSEKYGKINSSIRNINRAMDWAEKCFIDLYKLISQDTDILNIVDRVYIKTHIFESCDDLAITKEDVAGSVIPMDPSATGEAVSDKAIVNSTNKKTGAPPGYILNNHDMAKYGEDESDNKKKDDTSPITLDDYKRPSTEDDNKDDINPYASQSSTGDNPFSQQSNTPNDANDNANLKQAINNYYYYTYNNSLNKNHRDDHSDRSKHYDNSKHSYVNDNSVNKDANINKDEEEREFHNVEESDDPCKLNLGIPELITEGHFGHFGNFENPERRIENPTRVAKSRLAQLASQSQRTLSDEELDEPIAKKIDTKKAFDDMFADDYGESAQTLKGKNEYETLCKSIGKTPSADELKVPTEVDLIFDQDDNGTDHETSITMEFKKIKASKIFTDDGNYIKGDAGFDEVPIGVYWLNKKIKDGNLDGQISSEIAESLYKYITSKAKDQGEECPKYPVDAFVKFDLKADSIFIKPDGMVGFSFNYSLDPEHGIGVTFDFGKEFEVNKIGQSDAAFEYAYSYKHDDEYVSEDVGDADKDKPKSDHPVKDALMDIDRATTKIQQGAKRGVQNTINVGKAAAKPIQRTKQWIGNMISQWKDKNENQIKEDLADPNQRSALLKAVKGAITVGALAQAGLLLNPWIIGFAAINKFSKDKNKMRLRNEMIGELKTEMEIIDEKIKDAERNGDDKAKYQLYRFKNELNKKLLRVGGPDTFKKVL